RSTIVLPNLNLSSSRLLTTIHYNQQAIANSTHLAIRTNELELFSSFNSPTEDAIINMRNVLNFCNFGYTPRRFDSFIGVHSVSIVIDSMIKTCNGNVEYEGMVCNVVLECYSKYGLVFDGLEIFRRIVEFKIYPISIHGCNKLLDALQRKNEIKLGWCFCGLIVRYGVSMDMFTWSLIARLLCKEGKVENAVKLLNSGFSSDVIYDLVIQSYCQMGDFVNAVDYLNEMYCKNFTPGFRIYSVVLDGACKFDDVGVVEMIMRDMVVKELLPAISFSDYNLVIQKFCEFGRSYAAEMLFERALKEKSGVHNDSYGCMLRVLCKEGRVKEARRVYAMINEKGVSLSRSSYCAFADAICKEEPSEEVDKLLKDIISRGFVPNGPELSKVIADHCRQGRWKEAEGLLNVILEKGMLPDLFSCSSLVEYYCANGQVNLAIALNDRIQKLGGTLDVTTYNILLIGLFKERKTGEAIQVFDYMRSLNVGSSTSFSIMIIGLCHEREMRKAMKIHDEMLNARLKPDKATYKRLISKFS
ncbi:hypothetical protein AQUCO_01200138v1, partial [Aquilegia coerulea]